jgi:biotin-[acetyl-CoA-carboxylase] ligase BirA-like protein
MRTIALDTVDSTNLQAKRLVRSERITQPTLLIARSQSAGRGTGDRRWHSPRDAGVYLSLVRSCDETDLPPTTMFTLAAGVACAEFLNRGFDVPAGIKPVNDLVIDGRKLGGVLTEMLFDGSRATALIVGIGINVRRTNLGLASDGVSPCFLDEWVVDDVLNRAWILRFAHRLADRVLIWQDVLLRESEGCVEAAWRQYLSDDYAAANSIIKQAMPAVATCNANGASQLLQR